VAYPDLHADLSRAVLSDADLRGANLSGANLRGAFLRDVNLSGSNLSGANLSRAGMSERKGGAVLIRVDLSEADLSGAKLIGADLSGANLRGANLNYADLYESNLSGADLTRASARRAILGVANLSGAILSGAHLAGAELGVANLSGAILSCVDLGFANLSGANLSGADLTKAELGESIFVDIDLTSVIGLATCRHKRPSAVDHRTLEKSGSLPLEFLRGVGLSDTLIEYLPSLFGKAIQYYSCFISYSAKDDEFAKRIHADLQNNGVRCWFAPHDLPIGAKTWDAIDEAIKLRDKLLIVLSNDSIASDWVEDEIQKAFAEERARKELVVFPVRIDNSVMEAPEPWARKLRDQRNIGDFQNWKNHDAYKQSFDRVLRDLKQPPVPTANPKSAGRYLRIG
jgi:uncharacterized protein YjbI with pentapeptide repeats